MHHFQFMGLTENLRFGMAYINIVQQESDSVDENLYCCTVTQKEEHESEAHC